MFTIRQLKSKTDYIQASVLIERMDCYGNVPPELLQGTTMYGMTANGETAIFACIMAVVQGPHAYIDYLSVHPLMRNEGHATRLTEFMVAALYAKGVRELHACVHGENGASLQVCAKQKPLRGFPYTKMTFKLEEGEDNG